MADFQQGVADAHTAQEAGDTASQRTALERSIALYGGELLPGCYDDWLAPLREELHLTFLSTLEWLIQLAEDQRNYVAAIRYSEQRLRHDHNHEATYRLLMRLHALNGDRSRAAHLPHLRYRPRAGAGRIARAQDAGSLPPARGSGIRARTRARSDGGAAPGGRRRGMADAVDGLAAGGQRQAAPRAASRRARHRQDPPGRGTPPVGRALLDSCPTRRSAGNSNCSCNSPWAVRYPSPGGLGATETGQALGRARVLGQ